MTIAPINPFSNNLISIISAKLQLLTKNKNTSSLQLSQARSLNNTLIQLNTEAQNIEKNATLYITVFDQVTLSDQQSISKFFSNKIRLSDNSNYQTGSEVSFNGQNYFVNQLNSKDISLYETKEQAISGGSAGLISFSGNENPSIVKINRQTITLESQNYTETDAFKSLLQQAKNSISLISPLITKDFLDFQSKLSIESTKLQNGPIQQLDNQVKNLDNKISTLQNLLKILDKTHFANQKQSAFLTKNFN